MPVEASSQVHAGRHGHGSLSGRRCCERRAVAGKVIAIGARLDKVLGVGTRQGSSSRYCRLLDSADVVALVTRQCRLSRECLLAVGKWADVGTLAGMCSSMSGKRAAVAKLFAAGLALVRLLTSMNTLVNGQSRPLDELFPADIARMRPVSRMDAFVAAEIASAGKGAVAGTTLVCFLLLAIVDGIGRLHVRHGHVGNSGHVVHVRKTLNVHGRGHGAWDLHGCVHDSGRVVRSRHAMGGISRVIRHVWRI